MAKKAKSMKERWNVNPATMTEEEVRNFIDEMREEGRDEMEVIEFLEDVRTAKESGKQMKEKFGASEEFPNPFEINRVEFPDGIYEVIACRVFMKKEIDEFMAEKWSVKMDMKILDYETAQTADISQIYTEQFFQNLFNNLSAFFSDKHPKTLKECLILCKENRFFIQKKSRNGFTNYYPCRYSPVISEDLHTVNAEVFEL